MARVFYFRTDRDAPRGRVIAIDTRQPDPARWRTVIPQEQDVLQGVQLMHNRLVASYLHDAHSRVRLVALDGKPAGECPSRPLASVGQITGERKDDEMFYTFTSFLYPTHDLSGYDFDGRAFGGLQGAESRLRPGALRNQAGVLPEQGRHAGADVHHARRRA